MSLEEKRKASYKRLCLRRAEMDKAHKAFTRARAEYHRELEAYSKIDKEIVQQNATELPPVGEPKPKKRRKNNGEDYKELVKKARELFRTLPKEEQERMMKRIEEG